MSVSKSGRHFGRYRGLCEAWCAAGIRFRKGVEFYSFCHFFNVSPCTNPVWVSDFLGQTKYLRTSMYISGIRFGKGVEFYSFCHFFHVSPCTNPVWVSDFLGQSKFFTYFGVYFLHFPSLLTNMGVN